MGFLDFLKKDKGVPPVAISPRQDVDLEEVKRKIGLTDVPPPPGAMLSVDDDVPMPPPSMQDPDFLQSASDSLGPSKDEQLSMGAYTAAPVPAQASAPASVSIPLTSTTRQSAAPEQPMEIIAPPIPPPVRAPQSAKPLDLPDFSDEDFAVLQPPAQKQQATTSVSAPASSPAPVQKPEVVSAWAQPAKTEMRPETKTERYDLPRAPAQVAEPSARSTVAPPPGSLAFGTLRPAMFLSSDSYFAITSDVAQVRRVLRQNDDVLREAELQHEKGDEQLQRLAAEMNAVQESLLKLDAALFEE